MTVRTRFAPSPTGNLHIGGVRTALFNWLYAKHHEGEYLLRIEDTDQKRSSAEFVEDILAGLSWLGIQSDSEPVFQSSRMTRYQEVISAAARFRNGLSLLLLQGAPGFAAPRANGKRTQAPL